MMSEKKASGVGIVKWGLVLGLALLALVVIGGSGYAAFQFISYGNSATERAQINPSRVVINTPAHGGTLVKGLPVLVEVSSSGPEPFQKTELWLNGELVSVQEEGEQELLHWRTNFHWNPKEAGLYQLVARSYAGDQAVASTGTLVHIKAAEISGEVQEDVPVSSAGPSMLPAAPAGGGAGTPTIDPAESEAESWGLNPALWLQSLTVDKGPAAPIIQAEVEGCQVTLAVQDNADNEEGFLVRRQPVDALAAEEVESLAPHAGTGTFSFQHMSENGTFSYTVRSFNGQGTSDSNPAIVEVDPADCEENGSSSLAGISLNVELANLRTSIPVDRTYCYRSFDGTSWTRWPLSGFFGKSISDSPESSMNFLLDELDGEPEADDVELHLECWGWSGQELTFLGAVSQMLGEEGALTLADGILQVDLVQTLAETVGGYQFYPLSGHEEFDPTDFNLSDFMSSYYYLRMLRPFGLVSHNPDACKERLPLPLQNNAGKLLACFPYPGFNVGPGGDNPQPYLIWFPGNVCAIGQGIPPCIDYDGWLDLADKVGFQVWDKAGGTFENFESENWFVYNIKPYACEGTREFQVRMYAQVDGDSIFGEWSQPVTTPCQLPNQGISHVWVTFDKLRIMDASDGDFGQDDVEVYGYFKAYSSIDSFTLWLGQQSDWPSACDSEAFDSIMTDDPGTFGLGCRESLYNGTYEIETLRICEAPCPGNFYGGPNNRSVILVADGDKIDYVHSLTDYDTASGNDTVCFWSGKGGSKSYQEWQDYQSSVWYGGLFEFDNGNCEVLVQYNGANNPPGPQ